MNKRLLGNQKGISLIELMIVCSMIVILLGASVSSYKLFIARTRVKGALNQLMTIRKSFNYVTAECKGAPKRSNTRDGYEFMKIIDIHECDPAVASPNPYMEKFPYGQCMLQTSVGRMMGVEAGAGNNVLCRPACDHNDKNCQNNARRAVNQYFVGYMDDECSPEYLGPPYNGHSPGWNYNLLNNPADAISTPVGVICGMTMGNRSVVKMVVNTGGYYNGVAVADGTGRFDIDGTMLSPGCTCGPYCEEIATGEKGCCSKCGGEPSLGYKF